MIYFLHIYVYITRSVIYGLYCVSNVPGGRPHWQNSHFPWWTAGWHAPCHRHSGAPLQCYTNWNRWAFDLTMCCCSNDSSLARPLARLYPHLMPYLFPFPGCYCLQWQSGQQKRKCTFLTINYILILTYSSLNLAMTQWYSPGWFWGWPRYHSWCSALQQHCWHTSSPGRRWLTSWWKPHEVRGTGPWCRKCFHCFLSLAHTGVLAYDEGGLVEQ